MVLVLFLAQFCISPHPTLPCSVPLHLQLVMVRCCCAYIQTGTQSKDLPGVVCHTVSMLNRSLGSFVEKEVSLFS